MPEEVELWKGTPSQVINIGFFLIVGIFTLLTLIAALGAAAAEVEGGNGAGWIFLFSIFLLFTMFWRWLGTKKTRYEITSQRLKITTGILSETVDELELYRVKDTTLDKPFFLRMFGIGNNKH